MVSSLLSNIVQASCTLILLIFNCIFIGADSANYIWDQGGYAGIVISRYFQSLMGLAQKVLLHRKTVMFINKCTNIIFINYHEIFSKTGSLPLNVYNIGGISIGAPLVPSPMTLRLVSIIVQHIMTKLPCDHKRFNFLVKITPHTHLILKKGYKKQASRNCKSTLF